MLALFANAASKHDSRRRYAATFGPDGDGDGDGDGDADYDFDVVSSSGSAGSYHSRQWRRPRRDVRHPLPPPAGGYGRLRRFCRQPLTRAVLRRVWTLIPLE